MLAAIQQDSDAVWAIGGALGGVVLIAALVILVLDVVAIVQVLNSNQSTGIKALWVLAIVFFQVFGMLAWFLFGKKQATRHPM